MKNKFDIAFGVLLAIILTACAAYSSVIVSASDGGPRTTIQDAAKEGVSEDLYFLGKPTLLLVGDDRLARWKDKLFGSDWEVYNWSVSDITSFEVALNVMPRVSAGHYHSAVLSLGIQDAMTYQTDTDFSRSLLACIRTMQVCSDNVYVTSVPGIRTSAIYSEASCAELNKRIKNINENIFKVTKASKATYISLSSLYNEDFSIKKEYTDSNGILYSKEGFAVFYKIVSESMEK